MTSAFACQLAVAPLLQAAAPASSASTVAFIVALGAAAAIALLLVLLRLRTANMALAELRDKLSTVQRERKTLLEKEEKLQKAVESRGRDIAELKNSVAAQRKKAHLAQEENKKILDERKKERQAWDDTLSKQKRAAAAQTATQDHKGDQEVAPPKAQEPASATSTDRPRGIAPEVLAQSEQKAKEAQRSVDKLREDLERAKKALSQERQAHHKQKDAAKQAQRRAEQFRRSELILKGQLEVVQEKLRTVGRHYYETVSDLALLKGDVEPLPKDVFALSPATETTPMIAASKPPPHATDQADVTTNHRAEVADATRRPDNPATPATDGDAAQGAANL